MDGFTTGDWFPMTKKPWHWGEYEVHRSDGIALVVYDETGWAMLVNEGLRWRGQTMRTLYASEATQLVEVKPHNDAIGRYLGNNSETHGPAARGALWLARRAASRHEDRVAYQMYEIARRIQPDSLEPADRSWLDRCRAEIVKPEGAQARAEADTYVHKFFEQRGRPDKNGSPAGNPTLVLDELVPVESFYNDGFYHLARTVSRESSLCGIDVKPCNVGLDDWPHDAQTRVGYCGKCDELLGLALAAPASGQDA